MPARHPSSKRRAQGPCGGGENLSDVRRGARLGLPLEPLFQRCSGYSSLRAGLRRFRNRFLVVCLISLRNKSGNVKITMDRFNIKIGIRQSRVFHQRIGPSEEPNLKVKPEWLFRAVLPERQKHRPQNVVTPDRRPNNHEDSQKQQPDVLRSSGYHRKEFLEIRVSGSLRCNIIGRVQTPVE